MSISEQLRLMADLIDQGHPADMASAHAKGSTIATGNPITAARWREAIDRRPEWDASVVVVSLPAGVTG